MGMNNRTFSRLTVEFDDGTTETFDKIAGYFADYPNFIPSESRNPNAPERRFRQYEAHWTIPID